MLDKADVVVIGAGAYGASVAFHLAQSGVNQVVLLDKTQPVSQTSARAAGLSSQVQPTTLLTRMATSSVKAIERFEQDTGETLAYHRSGSLKMARTNQHAGRLRREVVQARQLGVDVELVTPDEITQLSPMVVADQVVQASYTPGDIYFEPGELPMAYLRAARRLGATVIPDVLVTGIGFKNNVVHSVITDQCEIHTPVVVDAAGAWSALVGNMVPVQIPLVPVRHQLLITQPVAEVQPSHPILRVMDVNVYIRPCNGGLMLGGYEARPRMFDPHALAPDMDIQSLELDITVLEELARQISDVLPLFGDFEVREHRGGLPTMTVDGNPLLGPLPGIEGFYVISGCCVGGLAKSPAMGRALAQWITEGQPAEDLQDAAPDRFAGQFDDTQQLVDACQWQYSHHYQKGE